MWSKGLATEMKPDPTLGEANEVHVQEGSWRSREKSLTEPTQRSWWSTGRAAGSVSGMRAGVATGQKSWTACWGRAEKLELIGQTKPTYLSLPQRRGSLTTKMHIHLVQEAEKWASVGAGWSAGQQGEQVVSRWAVHHRGPCRALQSPPVPTPVSPSESHANVSCRWPSPTTVPGRNLGMTVLV